MNKIISRICKNGVLIKDVLRFLVPMAFLLFSFILWVSGWCDYPNGQKNMLTAIMFFLFFLAMKEP